MDLVYQFTARLKLELTLVNLARLEQAYELEVRQLCCESVQYLLSLEH